MTTRERREQIVRLLMNEDTPQSATKLAQHFGVSRQIIVGDIAILRAADVDVIATARGYLLQRAETAANIENDSYVIACNHDKASLEAELYAIVDNGGMLLDVIIDHPIYGNITKPLEIRSRYEADAFLSQVAVTGTALLCSLTDGVHMHTIRCPDEESYRRILVTLKEQGLIYTK